MLHAGYNQTTGAQLWKNVHHACNWRCCKLLTLAHLIKWPGLRPAWAMPSRSCQSTSSITALSQPSIASLNFVKESPMKYRVTTCALILLALIACTNPLEPNSNGMAPANPHPQPTLPDWNP